jgi:hypothetical protein
MNLYEKINFLVQQPKYDCRTQSPNPTYSDIEWKDQRSMPTEAEVNAVTDEQISAALKDTENTNLIQNDKLAKLLFEIAFDQENRLRTQAGQPTITRAQYRNGILALWRNL